MDDRPHIVVVEDEITQRDMLVDYLSRHQFRVNGVENGTALRNLVDRELPSLVMLDVGLPGEDGFALARWLRERSGRIGIIMVTAASDTVDRVVGLETGADDYIAKPFEPRELLARVKSVLRRQTAANGKTPPRRLAAILVGDIAGYSRLVERDEQGTLNRLRALRRETIDPELAAPRSHGQDDRRRDSRRVYERGRRGSLCDLDAARSLGERSASTGADRVSVRHQRRRYRRRWR